MSDEVYDDLLTHTVSITRRSYNEGSLDSFGVPVETQTEATASAVALIQPLTDSIEITKRGKKEIATVVGFFKYSQSILADDIVEYNSIKYIVLGVQDAGGQAHHKEILMKTMEE